MTISERITYLAAELRNATPGHGHVGCDALDPCADCASKRAEYLHLLPLAS